MWIIIIFALFFIFCKRIEGFSERIEFRQHRVDISRCPSFNCLMKTENSCLNWCDKEVKNEHESGYCKYMCHELTEDLIDSFLWQHRQFDDAMYRFKPKPNMRGHNYNKKSP